MPSEAQTTAPKPKRRDPPSLRKVWIWFALCMLLMVAGTFAVYWYTIIQTYHLAVVQRDVLYRDGNRDLRELKHAITFTGAKTVLSLIDDRELHDPAKPQFMQESNYCAVNQIQYIRIPVRLGGWPTSDDLKTFITLVTDPANQPVLLHCAQGVRRTGMFAAAYQLSVMHQTRDQTKAEILSFKHKPADTDDVRSFIEDYNPATMVLANKQRGISAE